MIRFTLIAVLFCVFLAMCALFYALVVDAQNVFSQRDTMVAVALLLLALVVARVGALVDQLATEQRVMRGLTQALKSPEVKAEMDAIKDAYPARGQHIHNIIVQDLHGSNIG